MPASRAATGGSARRGPSARKLRLARRSDGSSSASTRRGALAIVDDGRGDDAGVECGVGQVQLAS